MEKLFSHDWVKESLKAELTQSSFGHISAQYSQITTDSRKISANSFFVAIPGEKFDGHDFIKNTLLSGATGVLCSESYSGLSDLKLKYPKANFYVVKDSLKSFRTLAHHWRMKFQIPVICVAGSVGKTTTKEMLAAALTGKFSSLLKTQGSFNGFVGIPITLFELRSHHQVAVIEIGIDDINTMTDHMEIVHPTHGILSAIGPEHLEKLIDVPTVAREESVALTWIAQQGGTVFQKLDDEWISKIKFKPNAKLITLGLDNSNAHFSGSIQNEQLVLLKQNQKFDLVLPGLHNVSNQLNAIAICSTLGMTFDEIKKGLTTFTAATGRTEIHKKDIPQKNLTYICDYYNANPSSMKAALALLKTYSAKSNGRLIAVLADMLELGPKELELHSDLYNDIQATGCAEVYLYGPRMKSLFDKFKSSTFSGKYSHHETHSEIAEHLKKSLKVNDTVLIKGSRGMKMEEVWKKLT